MKPDHIRKQFLFTVVFTLGLILNAQSFQSESSREDTKNSSSSSPTNHQDDQHNEYQSDFPQKSSSNKNTYNHYYDMKQAGFKRIRDKDSNSKRPKKLDSGMEYGWPEKSEYYFKDSAPSINDHSHERDLFRDSQKYSSHSSYYRNKNVKDDRESDKDSYYYKSDSTNQIRDKKSKALYRKRYQDDPVSIYKDPGKLLI